MKFEIKSRWSGRVVFAVEAANIKLALEIGVRQGADLQGADLQGADLKGADLQGAYLQGADFQDADLQRAYLKRADLQGADLQGAYLQGAYLRGADLKGADLKGADLQGADLKGADLQRADLQGAYGINRFMTTPLLILADQPGKIRAYKLVNAEKMGAYHNKGVYGSGIGIKYEIGVAYEVTDVDTDLAHDCGAGINLATLDWCMREWRQGYRILVAEFEAKDIVAIPTATDGKFRVSRCTIVGEKELHELELAGEEKASEQDRAAK